MVFDPLAISNTVPYAVGPAVCGGAVEVALAVQHQRRRTGYAPLVPLNEARVVMVFDPLAISNTVPSLLAPPYAVVP